MVHDLTLFFCEGTQYRNFQNDIFNFCDLLKKLNGALVQAQERFSTQEYRLKGRAYDPLSKDFDKERKLIVGNFQATLTECKSILERNKQLRDRQSNVRENLSWHLKQQTQRVKDLRDRLGFHSHKIRMVIDRLVINLLTDQDAKLDDVLALSEQNIQATNEVLVEVRRLRLMLLGHLSGQVPTDVLDLAEMHDVGTNVARRFEENLSVNAPSGIESGIPIAPGFDALLATKLSFEDSVVGTDQTPESYLLFLKTRWLLERIKSSDAYEKARPGFYYKRAVNQIDQATLAKMRQPRELIWYPESDLMAISDPLYWRIWPAPAPPPVVTLHRPHPLMERANEVEILNLNLASDESSEADAVTIFKSSEERFRIVLKQALPSSADAREILAQIVLAGEDKLIPRFALPTLITPGHELAIFSRGEETFYQFQSVEDLNRFQAALMGYEVSHNHNERDMFCQFSTGVKFLDCENAQIQIWQERVGRPPRPEGVGGARNASIPASQSSSSGSNSRHDSLVPIFTRASSISATPAGWEADPIRYPAIVIFSKEKNGNRFAMIFVELGPHMRIDPDKCSCWNDYERCGKLVLNRKDGDSFKVRVLYSSTDPGGQPDPNSFDLFQFRLPRHPKFHNLLVKKTEFLVLKFNNLPAKTQFRDALELGFGNTDKQLKEQREFESEMLYLQDQPKRVRQSFSQGSARS